MDKQLIEKYKQEMLKMYKSARPTVSINNRPIQPTVANSAQPSDSTAAQTNPLSNNTGSLTAIVTSLRSIYPVQNARVTIFEGDYDSMRVVDTALTDQSGKTRPFLLAAPSKELSLDSNQPQIPYALYNMLVQADGYVDNIHLNIPVFSSINSLQASNLMLLETAGVNKGPQIFDERQNYTL